MERFLHFAASAHLQASIKAGTARRCDFCTDPILPGDVVGIARLIVDGRTEEVLAHASDVKKLASPNFCPSGALGVAYWTGEILVYYENEDSESKRSQP